MTKSFAVSFVFGDLLTKEMFSGVRFSDLYTTVCPRFTGTGNQRPYLKMHQPYLQFYF